MTVQRHYVIVANHDDAIAYTYTNHGSALVEVKKWHNEFSDASERRKNGGTGRMHAATDSL